MNIRKVLGLALATMSGLISLVSAQDYTNKLTPDETNAAYDLLFNGTDLNNWHAYRDTQVTDAWKVRNNTPLGARIETSTGNMQPILTDKKYKNFDFKAEVQTPANGNSGVFARYEETALSSANTRSGPEFQICGPNHQDCISVKNSFGACYDMFPVKSSIRTTWYNPPGQWNQIRIVAFDSNYVHYGNGKKLLEYKIGTQEFLTAYGDSKYSDDGNNGRYYHIHPGGILLQHHTELGITFRNLKAKELDVHPFKREFTNGMWPDTLSQDFVFGKSPISVRSSLTEDIAEISVSPAGQGLTLVKIHASHDGFKALTIDGRAIRYRRASDGAYLLERSSTAPGIAIVQVRTGAHQQSRMISLL